MIFNNTANGLKLDKVYYPDSGGYKFQVVEFYDDLSPTYEVKVPNDKVSWEHETGWKHAIFHVDDEVFSDIIKKAEACGCKEVYVYPKFQ